MLWHLPPPVLQEWIQEVPTPSGRSGSHSTQNHPNFPQSLLPWWHRWGKQERRKFFFFVKMALNFLIKISDKTNFGSDSKNWAFPEDSGPVQCKETPSLPTLTSLGVWFTAIHPFQDTTDLLASIGNLIVWLHHEGIWVGSSPSTLSMVHKLWPSFICILD